MVVNFDSYDFFEKPSIILCKPNKEEMYSLSGIMYNSSITLRYNSMSEITFDFPSKTDIGEDIEFYDEIVAKRLVLLENIGYFLIVTVKEHSDGIQLYKSVTAYSIESELNYKKVNILTGTYKFYDPVSPSDTLLYEVMQTMKSWTIGTVDSDLWTKTRYYEINDETIYNFLNTTVEETLECIFVFDIMDKVVNVYTTENAVSSSDIFMSFDNLIKEVDVEEKSDELVTCLSVSGAGDLDVRTVNPLGSNKIYNFDYFLNSTQDWFSTTLKTAVQTWVNKIASYQTSYSNYLASYRTNNATLITYNSDLVDLQSNLAAAELVLKTRIEAGYTSNTTYVNNITSIESQITAKESQITTITNTITTISNNLDNINTLLNIDNNFTSAQLIELDSYIIENSYSNEAYIQTSIMDETEIQDMAQALYDHGSEVLDKLAQPRYTFTMDSANYLFMSDFQQFTQQTALGTTFTLEISEGVYAYPVLLEMTYSIDNPEDFSLTFGNRLRLDDADFTFAELFDTSINVGSTVALNSTTWSSWKTDYEDEVSSFITNALDCANNNVINASNQEIVISEVGLRGQKYNSTTGTYDNKKVWLINNMLAFTDDNWKTTKTALGEITTESGGSAYGIVGDKIKTKRIKGELEC